MKIVYYFNLKRPEQEKAVIKTIYGNEIIFIEETPWMTADIFEKGDFLVCNTVEELVNEDTIDDVDDIVRAYLTLINDGVELMFDRSTQCNSMFIKTLISNTDSFEGILRKCILNYKNQKNIDIQYGKKRMITARANGNSVGIKKGTKLTTKKSVAMKKRIRELSRDFDGEMSDDDVVQELGIARNTYYRYKKQMKGERENDHTGSKRNVSAAEE